MGYIFDALNKKRGDAGNAPANTPDPPAANDPELNPAADAVDQAKQANQDAASDMALRLSDVKFDAQPDTPEAGYLAQALPPADAQADRAASADAVNTTIHDAIDAESLPPAPSVTSASDGASADTDQPGPSALTFENTIDDDTASVMHGQGPVEIDAEPPAPVKGLWNRLLGRHLRGKLDDRLVAMTNPASGMSEEYRSIRTSILARHDNERHLVHTISSATPQEGKTITCVNLGLSFAELRNRNTVIIECDLRLPTFGKLLTCREDKPGLIDYLRGEAALKDIVQQIAGSPLHIIPAGGRVSDEAVQLLSSARMGRLIQTLRAKYDHVFIDTPPVLQLADAGILGSQSEEVLLVARMRRTPRPLVEQAVTTLTSYNAQVSGIIATDNPRSRGRGYGYKYGYRYGYGYTEDRKSDRSKRKERRAA